MYHKILHSSPKYFRLTLNGWLPIDCSVSEILSKIKLLHVSEIEKYIYQKAFQETHTLELNLHTITAVKVFIQDNRVSFKDVLAFENFEVNSFYCNL